MHFICYADDTLVIGSVDTIAEVESKINKALDAVTRRIELAGFNVAVEKTEATWFTNHRLLGVEINVEKTLKYLKKIT
mgnify:CR=1 FL=1